MQTACLILHIFRRNISNAAVASLSVLPEFYIQQRNLIHHIFTYHIVKIKVKSTRSYENTNMSSVTMAKLNTNQYVSLEVIDRICAYFQCKPGDLLDFFQVILNKWKVRKFI